VTPLILAADTTSEFGSLALARGNEIVEEIAVHAPDGFAHILYGEIAGLLARAGVAVGQVDCFAAASGPGSFTGVRVGLACVKGLAEATGKRAVGVSNLEVLATFGRSARRAVALDARRGEIYAALYDSDGKLASEERVLKLAAWLESLEDGVEFISADTVLDFSGTRFADAAVVRAPRVLAGAVAKIAFARWQRGEAALPEALDANYVRRSDAELFWKD
jgi:tRNA threonylcarbamoyladenosine biosynthesis protein TsaB